MPGKKGQIGPIRPSPQLLSAHPQWRIFAVFLDVVMAGYSTDAACVHPAVKSAFLAESDRSEGWTLSPGEAQMRARGWRSADDIFNEAAIPEKHRRVVELALWGNPQKHKGREFTVREIAEYTGHAQRTVDAWLSEDMPRLRALAAAVLARVA